MFCSFIFNFKMAQNNRQTERSTYGVGRNTRFNHFLINFVKESLVSGMNCFDIFFSFLTKINHPISRILTQNDTSELELIYHFVSSIFYQKKFRNRSRFMRRIKRCKFPIRQKLQVINESLKEKISDLDRKVQEFKTLIKNYEVKAEMDKHIVFNLNKSIEQYKDDVYFKYEKLSNQFIKLINLEMEQSKYFKTQLQLATLEGRVPTLVEKEVVDYYFKKNFPCYVVSCF